MKHQRRSTSLQPVAVMGLSAAMNLPSEAEEAALNWWMSKLSPIFTVFTR